MLFAVLIHRYMSDANNIVNMVYWIYGVCCCCVVCQYDINDYCTIHFWFWLWYFLYYRSMVVEGAAKGAPKCGSWNIFGKVSLIFICICCSYYYVRLTGEFLNCFNKLRRNWVFFLQVRAWTRYKQQRWRRWIHPCPFTSGSWSFIAAPWP